MVVHELHTFECWFFNARVSPEEDGALQSWLASNPGAVAVDHDWFDDEFVSRGRALVDEIDMDLNGGDQIVFHSEDAAKEYLQREPLAMSGMRSYIHGLCVSWLLPDEDDFFDGIGLDEGDFKEVLYSYPADLMLGTHYDEFRCILRHSPEAKELAQEKQTALRSLFERSSST
jgi:hypothetical protein